MKTPTLRSARKLITDVAALAVAFLPSTLFADGDPTGDWAIIVDMAGTPVEADMSVAKNDDGTLSGKLISMMGEAELGNVTFEGDKLAFTQTFGEGDAAMTFTFEGTLAGDTFAGMLSGDMGDMAVNGTRKVPVEGTWNFTSDSQLGVITLPLIINADMTGTYSEYTVENLALEGSKLTFDVTVEVDGSQLSLQFAGERDGGHRINGNFLMEGAEVATVVITRAGEIPGTWNITSDSPLGVVEHVLVFADATAGTLDGTELTDVVIEASNIAFNVSLDVQGQVYDLAFEGSVAGPTIAGAFIMDGSPVAEITGARAE